MMRHEGVLFSDRDVQLDGVEFVGCEFQRCVLVYSAEPNIIGDVGLHLTGCHFEDCQWSFVGAAGRTLVALRDLSMDGFAQVVERVIETIRGIGQPSPS